MSIRKPAVAGMFYPGDAASCRREVAHYLEQVPASQISGPILGGVVPHAGWSYSGATAAHLYAAIDPAPETVVLLGAVHRWGVDAPALYPEGAWRTPLGDCLIDSEFAETVLGQANGAVVASREAHAGEHAIEVQIPFIQYRFPQARILPVAVPPTRPAIAAGEQIAEAIRSLNRRAAVIASSDLTHYGPRYGMAPAGLGEKALAWAQANDQRLIDQAVALHAAEVLRVAAENHSACGAGAIAAAIAAAIACAGKLGATHGQLLHHTTSHEVLPMGQPSDFVGYAAIAFLA